MDSKGGFYVKTVAEESYYQMPFGMHCMKQRNQRVLLSMTKSQKARNLIINSKRPDFNDDKLDKDMITEHKADININ